MKWLHAPNELADVPAEDEDLPAYVAGLGLPGLVDIHVHFMPEQVLHKVWRYFDEVASLGGPTWPIRYRYDEQTRLETLGRLGVIGFSALNYPHKPGIKQWLNEWGLEFASRAKGCVPIATFYPEPGVRPRDRTGSSDPRRPRSTGLSPRRAHPPAGDQPRSDRSDRALLQRRYREVAPVNDGPYAHHWFEKTYAPGNNVSKESQVWNTINFNSGSRH